MLHFVHIIGNNLVKGAQCYELFGGIALKNKAFLFIFVFYMILFMYVFIVPIENIIGCIT